MKVPLRPHLVRTGVRCQDPVSSITRTQEPMSNSGTWISQGLQNMNLPIESSALISPLNRRIGLKDHQRTISEPFTTVPPMSELNTPEIMLDEFKFNDKASSNNGIMKMESSPDPFGLSSIVGCSNDEGRKSVEVLPEANFNMYDMSPASIENLDPAYIENLDPSERSIDLQGFVSRLDGSSPLLTNSTSTRVSSGHLLNSSDDIEHQDYKWLSPQVTNQAILPNKISGPKYLSECSISGNQELNSVNMLSIYNSPPELSIRDIDLEFAIPQNIEEQLSEIFPEEDAITEIVPKRKWESSTELDMYLGSKDLLSTCLEETGLDQDLEDMNFDVINNEVPEVNEVSFAADNVIPFEMLTPEWKEFFQPSNSRGTMPVDFILPEAQSSDFEMLELSQSLAEPPSTFKPHLPTSFKTHLQASTEKHQYSQVSGAGKRLKRTPKKPVRYRESEYKFEEDSQSSNSTSSERLWDDTLTNEVKDAESNVAGTSSSTRRGRASEDLTPEQKYHRIRILNNEASKRCRRKRKTTIKEMQSELGALEERNAQLKREEKKLKELRNRLRPLVHKIFRGIAGANNT